VQSDGGVVATCAREGANRWRSSMRCSPMLKGKHVSICNQSVKSYLHVKRSDGPTLRAGLVSKSIGAFLVRDRGF
jgi:hypothetical protein